MSQSDGTCGTYPQSLDPDVSEKANFTVPLKAGISVGVFILLSLLVAAAFWWWYRKMDLRSLPADVRWFYERYQAHPGSWEKIGTLNLQTQFPNGVAGEGGTSYYQKEIEEGTEAWHRMEAILNDFALGQELVVQGMSCFGCFF